MSRSMRRRYRSLGIAAAIATIAPLTALGAVDSASASTPVTTFAALQSAATAAGTSPTTITLGSNITSSGTGLVLADGSNVTLDLAGHRLTVSGSTIFAGITDTGATLTINGPGSINATGGPASAAGIGGNLSGSGGTLIINSGTVTAVGGSTIGVGGAGIGGGGRGNYALSNGGSGPITIGAAAVVKPTGGSGANADIGNNGGGSPTTITNNGTLQLAPGGAGVDFAYTTVIHRAYMISYSTDAPTTHPEYLFGDTFQHTGAVLKTPPAGNAWFLNPSPVCADWPVTTTTDFAVINGPVTTSGFTPTNTLTAALSATLTFKTVWKQYSIAPLTLLRGCAFPMFPGMRYRPGYTFDGWYTAPIGGAVYSAKTLTHDTTIYAQWTHVSATPRIVARGRKITFTGTGYRPGELVSANLHSKVFKIRARSANRSGVVVFTAVVPRRLTVGRHTATLTGQRSHRRAATVYRVK